MPDENGLTTVVFGDKTKVRAPDTPSFELYADQGEKKQHHRAFLLWAMQDADKRQGRRVSKAMRVGESVVRSWRVRWAWEARVASVGDSAQARAVQQYKRDYLAEWNLVEVAVIEPNMSAPFHTFQPVSADGATGPAVQHEARRLLEAGRNRAEKAVPVTDDPAARAERMMNKGLLVIEGLVQRMAQLVADPVESKKLASKTDLSKLMREYRETAQMLGILKAPQGAGTVLEPSYRVQLAQRRGESIIEAMRHDAEEALAVLRSLHAAERMSTAAGPMADTPPATQVDEPDGLHVVAG